MTAATATNAAETALQFVNICRLDAVAGESLPEVLASSVVLLLSDCCEWHMHLLDLTSVSSGCAFRCADACVLQDDAQALAESVQLTLRIPDTATDVSETCVQVAS